MVGGSDSGLDIVCPCRTGNKNNELRYAMRSWEANVPHRDLYLWGAPPAWTQNVIKRPMQQGSNFRLNTTKMMLAACQDPDISNPFIWMNDDYFVMKPIPEVPRLNRGPIDRVIAAHPNPGHQYPQGMVATKNLLIDEGFSEEGILSYELHMPMLIYKTTMIHALQVYFDSRRPILHKRTLYGNIVDYGGLAVPDNKVVERHSKWDSDCTFISTSDMSFEKYPIGAWIKERFPLPSTYEFVERDPSTIYF